MSTTYAAIWSDDGGRLAGCVRLGSSSLHLDGSASAREARRRIPYAEISSLRLARNGDALLAGRPTLVVGARGIPEVRIAITQPGALHELLESLTKLTSEKGMQP